MPWLFAILLLLLTLDKARSLVCFEGTTNCEERNQCDQCEGVACVRVARPSRRQYHYSNYPDDSKSSFIGGVRSLIRSDEIDFHGPDAQVALTCLPIDTRTFDLEPEGCRTDSKNQLRQCICYSDYCNSGNRIVLVVTYHLIALFALFTLLGINLGY